jgi:hypothetical protein
MKIGRRSFISLAAAAAAAVGSGFFLLGESYSEWYKRKLSHARGWKFEHMNLDINVKEVTDKVKKKIEAECEKELDKRGLNSDRTLKLKIDTEYYFYELAVSNDTFDAYKRRVMPLFFEFYDFVKRPDLIPKVELRKMQKSTKLQKPADVLPVYVVWQMIENYMCNLTDPEKGFLFTKQYEKPSGLRGRLGGSYSIPRRSKDGIEVEYIPKHIIVAVGHEQISSLSANLSETVPFSVCSATAEKIKQDALKWYDENPKERKIDLKVGRKIVDEWIIKEDSFVEAVIDDFVQKRLDFSKKELQVYLGAGDLPYYKQYGHVTEQIKKHGSPAVFDMYLTDTDRVFS